MTDTTLTTLEPALWSYQAGFVADPDALLTVVRDEVQWTGQMRARNTASMGIPYNYAGATYPETGWHPEVWAVAEQVKALLGFRPTNCLLNRYDSGTNSIGWHADDVTILAPGTGIAIVSLGAERTLQLRSGEAPDFAYEAIAMSAGSLLTMSAKLQHTHKHCIKPQKGAGLRISLTFRHLTHAPPPVTESRWGRKHGSTISE